MSTEDRCGSNVVVCLCWYLAHTLHEFFDPFSSGSADAHHAGVTSDLLDLLDE